MFGPDRPAASGVGITQGADRPTGTVTFAFTDLEGSTRRWEDHRAAMAEAVARHDAVVRVAIERHGGYVFKALGDAFCAAFSRPQDALAAMTAAQRALAEQDFSAVGDLPMRVAIHTGTAEERSGDYFGPALNRVARLVAIGHGGQILCSGATTQLVLRDLPDDAQLRDLGAHELRDLDTPERVFQLVIAGLRDDFPKLRSATTHENLPVQLTSFVGRERETAEIGALVRAHRAVTLIGAGGVGKTRVALFAGDLLVDEFDDGVWLVELAPLTDGAHVAPAVAAAVGLTLSGAGDAGDAVLRYLANKRALLILDNCEHLASAVAPFATGLLRGAPHVKILATSRQPLEIGGERTYRVPSLDETASVELFVQRAKALDERASIDPADPAIADICRQLDGIPLAIELAASRTSALSPRQIAQRLSERFRLLAGRGGDRLPRQQTLRALIDWSYDLLDERERAVFARLAVFAGGWTLPAASAVCTDEAIDEWEVLDLLGALVEKSLVVSEIAGDERRYHMLHSIREYARERLHQRGEETLVAAKHAAYFAAFARERFELALALEDERWQRTFAPEIDNLRGALETTLRTGGDAATGFVLLAHLEWPELIATPLEAIRWYDTAAGIPVATPDGTVRALVLRHHVRLEWMVGRPTPQREAHALEAFDAARQAGDADAIAHAAVLLASVYRDARRFDEAERLFAQASHDTSALTPGTRNVLLRNWAVASLQQGDLENARLRFTEVASRERAGSLAHASALLNIGELEFALGNVGPARDAAGRARDTFARLNAAPLGLAICNLAAYALSVDDLANARELLHDALETLKRTGARWTPTALEHGALLALLLGDPELAALLAGYTQARLAADDTRQTTERMGRDRLIRLLGEAFGEDGLRARLDAGSQLSEEQAIARAEAIHHYNAPNPAAPAAEKRGE